MEIKTFRAKTMPQALDLVRRELGPEAMVLHTRELNAGLVGRLLWGRAYEIAATPSPVREPARAPSVSWEGPASANEARSRFHAPLNPRDRGEEHRTLGTTRSPSVDSLPPDPLDDQIAELQSLVEQLRERTDDSPQRDLPPALFDLYTDMIEADIDEGLAREFLDRLRRPPAVNVCDKRDVRTRLSLLLENELAISGPIHAATGAGRVVALVGPTGVGKTTTVAKLAANYRLKENRRVGLITVDTYRIAAVEQLRTYAEIIDLPMEVVSNPREMRAAVHKMREFDLILMDTAGRSPRDEVRIRELRAMLTEAEPAEVHLVLSAAASARSLKAAAEKFAPVGVTAVIATKLDEATGLGNLLSLAQSSKLPFSYLTDGQNVPDDITVAEPRSLAHLILGL